MKKIISLSLAIIMIALTFTSCSKPNEKLTEGNVTKTVNAAFSALKSFNTADLRLYVDSGTLGLIISYAEQHEQFVKLGQAIFKNLEYEIKEVDLDHNDVKVLVKNKDLTEAATSFTSDLSGSYSTFQLLSKLSDESWLDSKLADITPLINDAPDAEEYTELTLHIKQHENHLSLQFDSNAENAVSGGAITAIKSVF